MFTLLQFSYILLHNSYHPPTHPGNFVFTVPSNAHTIYYKKRDLKMNILYDYRICRAELKECLELKEEYVMIVQLYFPIWLFEKTQATI